MKNATYITLLSIALLAAGTAAAAPVANGNITGLVANTLTPRVGEAVTIRIEGTLQLGKKCRIAGGIAVSGGTFTDLGLLTELPQPLATTFVFDKPGVHFIHVYPGTQDADNYCTQSGVGSVRVTVPEAPALRPRRQL